MPYRFADDPIGKLILGEKPKTISPTTYRSKSKFSERLSTPARIRKHANTKKAFKDDRVKPLNLNWRRPKATPT